MRQKNPKISVIILNWNGKKFLKGCVESILNQTYKDFEIIVVDNASTDNSIKLMKQNFPSSKFKNILLIENKKNLGYCEGNNIGIKKAKGEFIITLNPDIVLDKNFLKEILKPFSNKKVGIVSPKALRMSDKGRIDSVGSIAFKNLFATAKGAGRIDLKHYRHDEETFGAIGAYAAYRKEMLDDIKLNVDNRTEYFDSDFFTYFDEHDLQIRAHLRGWLSAFARDAICYHFWRYSIKQDLVTHAALYTRAFRNYYLSLIKNISVPQIIRSLPSFFLTEFGLVILSLVYKKPIFLSTKVNTLKLFGKMWEKRKIIQSRKTVSDKELLKLLSGNFMYIKFLIGVLLSEFRKTKLLSVKKE